MTFQEFHARVLSIHQMQPIPGELRLGQVFFNELVKIRPDIAEELRGSMIDPFFKERITNVVGQFCRERW